jgi:hypothetical protein
MWWKSNANVQTESGGLEKVWNYNVTFKIPKVQMKPLMKV